VRRIVWSVGLIALAMLASPASLPAHGAKSVATLSKIGPAPDFELTTQTGTRLSLRELRGRVVAVTFIYASCVDTCPLLTAKLAGLQARLGADFGPRVFFASVTVDPERDTPEVLKRYAAAHGANPAGWAFLTGTPAEIRDVAHRYGVFARKNAGGDVDHTFLTSLIDGYGVLRVQYLGVRFNPDELLADIKGLVREARAR
jgi:protein SCO1/2